MSRPEQNARPAPVITSTRRLSSKFARQTTCRISRIMVSSNAFSLSGRFSVSTPIRSGRNSKRMVVKLSACVRNPAGRPSLVNRALLMRKLLR
jgi:hypothetical protein